MKTQISLPQVKHSPIAKVVLSNDLIILGCSDVFKTNFSKIKGPLEGNKLTDVFEDIPEQLLKDMDKVLDGTKIYNPGHKYFLKTTKPRWLRWNINIWTSNEETLDGIILILEDVSHLMREKELLLKAEQVSKTGSWELNLLTNELYWSPMTKLMHEVPLDFTPVLEEGVNFFKEGFSREKIALCVSEAIAYGTPYDVELILITAKGNEIWIRAKGEPEMLNGKCVRLFGTIQDIDKKKKAELKYKETSERLQLATKAAQIGIWELFPKENRIVCNDILYEIFSAKKGSLISLEDWIQNIHPEDKKEVQSELEKTILSKAPLNMQFRAIKPNNEIIHLIGKAQTQTNHHDLVVKVIGAIWDITESKLTKLKLERNKVSFMETFQNSAVGMALVSKDGNWLKVNKGLCTSLGYSEEELMDLTFQDLTHPEDLDKDLKLLKETIEGKRESYQIEKRYFHKNGDIIYAILTVTVVRKLDGDISHFISQVLDITQRKETEKKLNSLLDVTRQQNESLMNFAHIVSHNLRSHSTNMTMLTKFLAEEKNENEKQNLIGMLANASHGLSETIHHLSEVVQFKAGAMEKMQSVNLLKILKSIEKSIEILLQEYDTSIELKVDPTHFIMGVPAYIESIFFNLYTNSLKYRSPERKPFIKISSRIIKNVVEISFSDNGQGIDLKRHGDNIFGMFKTFHNNQDAKGIGLFISKNQVVSMGGSIEVQSTPQVGTTFIVTLKKS